ncbi:hypothetical protein [Desulfocurvibacter africanus]|uniref:Uncharacterized protein n=1 Tax=Desulfocurvibacter africanus subsp. africanus str. Walvis Bay TaxID=690850 RepID=F3YXK1_DESAF|nr:hypothetical protein [Desulfocurvibacter africanus]EGJ51778.1 hypothetical protein Desaf_3494 [Desulfocurvibacter africanus subsp. africanus str. Walvis Bay]
MSLIPIYCDICCEHIANAEQDGLRLPLMGAMFQPREAGFPHPIPDEATWEFMRCPFGPHRPFIEEHLIQVGPATPGNRPVLDLTADEVELETDEEQPESNEPDMEPRQPQAQHTGERRPKRRGRN